MNDFPSGRTGDVGDGGTIQPGGASERFSNEAFERNTPTTKQESTKQDDASTKSGDSVAQPTESGVEATTENLNANEAAIGATLTGAQDTVNRYASGMSTQQGAELMRQTAATFANQSLDLATSRGDKYGIQAAKMMQKQFTA
ncbi:MAG: hypothetical protein K2X93_24530 [Candidatus Obscuribacterales bacterium]|nr:hypothetical protein [Candidatus Obscuribacterales bacterium]